jgi:hypothetical protein
MADAFIKNGAIVNAKIANAAIDNAKISSLSADKITAGTVSTSRLNIDGATLSANSNGELVVNAINASQITAGSINATVMSGTTVYADNMTGDVAVLQPFRSTATKLFRGNTAQGGGTIVVVTQQLPATTHATNGHKPFASITGWYDSTSSKTYSFKMYMQDLSGGNQSLGAVSSVYTQYGIYVASFSGNKTNLVTAGQTVTATGKTHTVTSVNYQSSSNLTNVQYTLGSGSAFAVGNTVSATSSSAYQLVGETRFKANTNLYAQFALSGSLSNKTLGAVNMKLEVTRTGSSGIGSGDNSTSADYIHEVSGFIMGAR